MILEIGIMLRAFKELTGALLMFSNICICIYIYITSGNNVSFWHVIFWGRQIHFIYAFFTLKTFNEIFLPLLCNNTYT